MNTIVSLCLVVASLTAAGEDPREAARRLGELSRKYRTPSGAVETSRMSPGDATEYARLQAFLRKHDLESRVKPPKSVPLDELPELAVGLWSGDIGDTGFTASALLQRGERWAFLALLTESMLPVPLGWQSFESGPISHLVFPHAEWTGSGPQREIDPRSLIDVQVTVRTARDAAALHASYARIFAKLVESGTLTLSDPVALDAGRGYFAVRSPQIGKVSLIFFAPDPAHPGEGFQLAAHFFEERWGDLRPVLETMLHHWHKLDGRPLGAAVTLDAITIGEAATAPATEPAASR